MSRASNSLKASDVITTPIKLKYTSSYDCSAFADYGIRVLDGVNGPVTVTGSVAQATLNYLSARNLYYSNYLTGSIQQVTSSADNSLQSTAAIGTGDADIRYFPTESNATIKILSIPTNVFGQQLSRQGFALSSSLYYVIDDGNGNLIDRANTNTHVGNIIYSQGMAIITDSNYQNILPVNPYVANNLYTFTASDTPKTFNILSNAIAGTGTIDPTTAVLFDKDAILFTNNLDGTVTLNTTNVGVFQTNYTVESIIAGSCNSPSNKGLITVKVLPIATYIPTTTTTTSTTTTTTTVPTTTSTTTTTTTVPTTTSTTTTTTTPTPTTTSTTTTTTTVPTTTSTTTTTTTPTPTTTSTTTTTTTTTSAYNYYSITRYNCPGCTINTIGLFGRTTNPTSLTNGYYYNNGDGFVYLVNFSTAGPSFDVDLDGLFSSGTNCAGTCGI
jgi:hypothetical protein